MKLLFHTLFVLAFSSNAYAQSWQIGIDYQYALGYPTQRYDHIYIGQSNQSTGLDAFTNEAPFSFGGGSKLGINGGYTWKNGWSAAMAVRHFKGATIVHEQTNQEVYNNELYTYSIRFDFAGTYYSVEPTVTKYFLTKKRRNKWHPFVDLAGILSFNRMTLVLDQGRIHPNRAVYGSEEQREFFGGYGLGFSVGIGMAYTFSKHFAARMAAGFTYLTYAPRYNELTKFIDKSGPIDNLSWVQENARNYAYYEYFPEGEVPDFEEYKDPTRMAYQYAPFNSIGVQVGLVYSFGKRKKR